MGADMTDPSWPGQQQPQHPPGPPPNGGGGAGKGAGVAVGIVSAPVLLSVLVPLAVGGIGFVGAGLVLLAGVIAGFVLLFNPQPFWRGVGAGMLGAYGVLLLLFGACFAILVNADFG
jgi:hypothetical protein